MATQSERQEMLRLLAEADAPAVVAEARAAARRRVSALLEDELAEALLRAIGEAGRPAGPQGRTDGSPPIGQRQPAQTSRAEAGEAWWTYCVLGAERAQETATRLTGLEGAPVEAIVEGELAALVSSVPLSEYGDEQLRQHLEDIGWLERTARGHEAVLEAALGEESIVPLRLCTLYRDRDGVRRLLREQETALSHSLSCVSGCLEWGIKVFLDHETAVRAASADAEPATDEAASGSGGSGSGSGYLAARQRERALAAQLDAMCIRCGEDVETALRPLIRANRINSPQRPEAHGRAAEMILNAAYLVERTRQTELEAAVSELHSQWEPRGLSVELTGPWPPYNFVADSAGMLG